jgi:drug/metabolite transporter (DMT)-like permease
MDGAATILLQILGGLSALIFFPFFEVKFPHDPVIYVTLAIACVFYAINDRLNTTARKHIEVSTFSILAELSSVFLIVIGLTVFREPFLVGKIIGAIIVMTANVLLVYKKGRFNLNKYTIFAILAQFAYSTAISIDIGISKNFNLPIYIMLTLAIPALLIFLFEKHSVKEITNEWNNGNKVYFVITGLSWNLAILFMLRAYQLGPITTITPVAASAVLFNVLVAALFLKEREEITKKVILAILTVIGISMTVWFK